MRSGCRRRTSEVRGTGDADTRRRWRSGTTQSGKWYRPSRAHRFDRADGSPWNPDSFSWAFANLVRRAKLPKIRLHDLRHSHATLALSAGTDLKTTSAALGHSAISITANIYVHAIESMQRGHADRIDALLGDTVANAIGGTLEPAANGSGPQRAHAQPVVMKKACKCRPDLVAPAGFEPLLGGSGESRPLPIRIILQGFSAALASG
jgi:hypothetical protein